MLFVSRDNEVFANSTRNAIVKVSTRVISKSPWKSRRVCRFYEAPFCKVEEDVRVCRSKRVRESFESRESRNSVVTRYRVFALRNPRVSKPSNVEKSTNVRTLWRTSSYLYSLRAYLRSCIEGSEQEAHNASFKSGNSGSVVNYFHAVAGHFVRWNVWRTMAAETVVPRLPE